jgi:hypothetical protein
MSQRLSNEKTKNHPIRVICRLRPFLSWEKPDNTICINHNIVEVRHIKNPNEVHQFR